MPTLTPTSALLIIAKTSRTIVDIGVGTPTLKGLKKAGKQSRQKELQGKVGSQIRERQNSRPEKTPLFSRAATAPPDPHPLGSGKNIGFCIKV